MYIYISIYLYIYIYLYWGLQEVQSDFYIRSYRKTQTNFLTYPVQSRQMKHSPSNTSILTARPLHTRALAFVWLSLLLLFSEVPSSRKSSLTPCYFPGLATHLPPPFRRLTA